MEEREAVEIAQATREEHQVPARLAMRGASRRIIELPDGPADAPLVRDVWVWVVRLQDGIAWCELAVDEATGKVVRVQRSRA